jgi:hypothetical protein
MKLFKLITTALVAGIILLFIKQNIAAFTTRIPFVLDLFIREPVNWGHSVYGLIIMSGFVGFIVGFLVLLRPYMNMRRQLAEKREHTVAKEAAPTPPHGDTNPEDAPTAPSQD